MKALKPKKFRAKPENFDSAFKNWGQQFQRRVEVAAGEALMGWSDEVMADAAQLASISKDPDQMTRYYPGYLRDSATTHGAEEGRNMLVVRGEFLAEYSAAHHEEFKNYRYGIPQYLMVAFSAKHGLQDFAPHWRRAKNGRR